MALVRATLTGGSDTSNVKGATNPYTTALVTLTTGRGYVMFIKTTGTTGDPTTVQTNGAALSFSKVISQVNSGANLTAWKIDSAGSTVTAVINISTAVDGSGCLWGVFEYTGHNTAALVAQSVKQANAGQASIAQTLAALASVNNQQIAAWGINDNSGTDVPSGTNWTNIGNGTTMVTPSVAIEFAENTSGTAQQLTGSTAGSFDREMVILEIAAATVASQTVTATLADSFTFNEYLLQSGTYEYEVDNEAVEFEDVLEYTITQNPDDDTSPNWRYWRERPLRRRIRHYTPRP